jgi:hypothetical protein
VLSSVSGRPDVLIDARNPPTEPVPAQQNYPAILGVLDSRAIARFLTAGFRRTLVPVGSAGYSGA